MEQKTIAVGSLGGTIAMCPAQVGEAVTPSLTAVDLLTAVPQISDFAQIKATSICNVGSPAMQVANVVAAYEFALSAVKDGASGVVLTHGTDTLEETAYLLDLIWNRPEPIVVTGAMRHPSMAGADGPANLLAAVITATSVEARGLGVLTVLDDTIHLARLVRKTDTTAVWTFQSPGWGPVGRVVENQARFMFTPMRTFSALPVPSAEEVRIPIIEVPHSEDAQWIAAITQLKPAGLVVAGNGAGHVGENAVCGLTQLVAAGVPVILASRVTSGTTLTSTYGFNGSETDLLARGLIGAGFLAPSKARILLHVLVQAGYSMAQIRQEFSVRGH